MFTERLALGALAKGEAGALSTSRARGPLALPLFVPPPDREPPTDTAAAAGNSPGPTRGPAGLPAGGNGKGGRRPGSYGAEELTRPGAGVCPPGSHSLPALPLVSCATSSMSLGLAQPRVLQGQGPGAPSSPPLRVHCYHCARGRPPSPGSPGCGDRRPASSLQHTARLGEERPLIITFRIPFAATLPPSRLRATGCLSLLPSATLIMAPKPPRGRFPRHLSRGIFSPVLFPEQARNRERQDGPASGSRVTGRKPGSAW